MRPSPRQHLLLPDSGRIAYVGIDNEMAGRTAGFLAAHMTRRSGPVVVLTGNLGLRAHAERLAGFRAGLLHETPEASIAAVLEGFDEDDRVARLLTRAFRKNPNTAVIYNSGGCLTVVASALRKFPTPAGTVFIGHELNAESRVLLEQRMMTLTIDQAVELQARRAVEVLLHHYGHVTTPSGPTTIPFTLHTRANSLETWASGTEKMLRAPQLQNSRSRTARFLPALSQHRPSQRRKAAAWTDVSAWHLNPCAAGRGRSAPR